MALVTVPDARAYADEIAALFSGLGWKVRVDNAMAAGPAPKDNTWITVRDAANKPLEADMIFNALLAADIPIQDK